MIGMIVISGICIACAFLLWHIADRRGASTRWWALMGAVFGPLAIPFVLMTKDKNAQHPKPESSAKPRVC
jgi:hypothetical protein